MTIYSSFAPDLLWVLFAISGVGAVIAGWAARPRIGQASSRRLVRAGLVLLAGLVVYSLLMTWLAAPPGPTK